MSNYQSAHNSNKALTDDQIRAIAPSVFATSAQQDVSSRYSFLPTSAILDGMRAEGWQCVKAQDQRVRAEGREGFQKHMLRFCQTSEMEVFEQFLQRGRHEISRAGLAVRTEIVLVNSHDRTSSYQLHAGLMRLICYNGLCVSDSILGHIAITHINFEPSKVIEASFEILKDTAKVTESMQAFQDRQLTYDEQLALAAGAHAYRWEDKEKAPVQPKVLLQGRRSEDVSGSGYGERIAKSDLWTTFNVVQENVVKGGQKDYDKIGSARRAGHRSPGKVRAIKGIDEDLKFNKALWAMAEQLRAGKI